MDTRRADSKFLGSAAAGKASGEAPGMPALASADFAAAHDGLPLQLSDGDGRGLQAHLHGRGRRGHS